jgi:PAS domain S-box-containing protein
MPIVVITEYGDMDLALQALKLGVADFLMKPVKLLELDAVLEKSVRIGILITQCANETNTLPVNNNDSQERGKTRHRTFFALVAVAFTFALFTLILIIFTGRENIAEQLDARELQAEIAGRKLAEARLRESERLYNILSENTRDVVWIIDMDLRPTYVNPAVTRVLGYNTEEAMKLAWEDLCGPECLKAIKKMFLNELSRELVVEQDAYRLQTVRIKSTCRDGSVARIEVKCASLRNLENQPVGLIVIFHEIDEDTQAEHLQAFAYDYTRSHYCRG